MRHRKRLFRYGCHDQLIDLLGRIPIDWSGDRLVFMGDYIDRGLKSFEVVEHLIGLQARHPGIVFLKGNHEQMLMDYLSGKDRMTYLYNGGQQTLESYLIHSGAGSRHPIPDAHLRFFESLALFHETENHIFVHAGLRQNVPMDQQGPEDLLWIREKFIDTPHFFGKRVVFGHTPVEHLPQDLSCYTPGDQSDVFEIQRRQRKMPDQPYLLLWGLPAWIMPSRR